jgi:hypothetical protein
MPYESKRVPILQAIDLEEINRILTRVIFPAHGKHFVFWESFPRLLNLADYEKKVQRPGRRLCHIAVISH